MLDSSKPTLATELNAAWVKSIGTAGFRIGAGALW